jgi:hypothetical protein
MAGGPSGVGGTNSVSFDAMQQLVGAGDMESALLAFGIERAQGMEKLVKAKIADMRSRNGEIQELQKAMQELRSVKPEKDEKGKALTGTLSASTQATLAKYPELGKFIDGDNKLKNDKGFEDMMANFQSQIDEMTSNDQLDMIQLQSMVSKQNNAIEMVSNLQNKFAGLKDKIVGNMR